MSFLSPKAPKLPPPPNVALKADASGLDDLKSNSPEASLISTSAQGLKRRAKTQRVSLIGGV